MSRTVSPRCKQLLDDAGRALHRKPIPTTTFMSLMQSHCREVQALACCTALQSFTESDHHNGQRIKLLRACRSFLIASIQREQQNEHQLSTFECAHCICELFQIAWSRKELGEVNALRDGLAQVCHRGVPMVIDAVVTGALEHLFVNREIRKYFSVWLDDSKLSTLYTEGCQLADGFN